MFGGFHAWDLIIVLVIALLIFGPKKLPEMGSAIGKSIKEFRKGMNELSNPDIPRKSELSAPKEMHSETSTFSASKDTPGETSPSYTSEEASAQAPND
ncbi:MAG TPA: twin-arginine translocase TatA/TatE family subunit [Ktedonobacteraceae bacterium]|jgi:TatA/E family protein of Tat protein translocase|nr:twin-arginine translocase TatA/TatE family subunit [Ktedonobacteraceae bacterium]